MFTRTIQEKQKSIYPEKVNYCLVKYLPSVQKIFLKKSKKMLDKIGNPCYHGLAIGNHFRPATATPERNRQSATATPERIKRSKIARILKTEKCRA